MNNKIAIGLITGFILSLVISFISCDIKYFHNMKEITKERYIEEIRYIKKFDGINAENKLRDFSKKRTYNNLLTGISFLGGIGIGYLFAQRKEKQNFKIPD